MTTPADKFREKAASFTLITQPLYYSPSLRKDGQDRRDKLKRCAPSVLRHTLLLVTWDASCLVSLSSHLCHSLLSCSISSHIPLIAPFAVPDMVRASMPAFLGACTAHTHDRRQAFSTKCIYVASQSKAALSKLSVLDSALV